MKPLMIVTILSMAFTLSMSAANANETHCQKDASHSTPPVPNYPTQVRNVVWRNTRALCLTEQFQVASQSSQSSTSSFKKPVDQKAAH